VSVKNLKQAVKHWVSQGFEPSFGKGYLEGLLLSLLRDVYCTRTPLEDLASGVRDVLASNKLSREQKIEVCRILLRGAAWLGERGDDGMPPFMVATVQCTMLEAILKYGKKDPELSLGLARLVESSDRGASLMAQLKRYGGGHAMSERLSELRSKAGLPPPIASSVPSDRKQHAQGELETARRKLHEEVEAFIELSDEDPDENGIVARTVGLYPPMESHQMLAHVFPDLVSRKHWNAAANFAFAVLQNKAPKGLVLPEWPEAPNPEQFDQFSSTVKHLLTSGGVNERSSRKLAELLWSACRDKPWHAAAMAKGWHLAAADDPKYPARDFIAVGAKLKRQLQRLGRALDDFSPALAKQRDQMRRSGGPRRGREEQHELLASVLGMMGAAFADKSSVDPPGGPSVRPMPHGQPPGGPSVGPGGPAPGVPVAHAAPPQKGPGKPPGGASLDEPQEKMEPAAPEEEDPFAEFAKQLKES
jgi:hypothetical protein